MTGSPRVATSAIASISGSRSRPMTRPVRPDPARQGRRVPPRPDRPVDQHGALPGESHATTSSRRTGRWSRVRRRCKGSAVTTGSSKRSEGDDPPGRMRSEVDSIRAANPVKVDARPAARVRVGRGVRSRPGRDGLTLFASIGPQVGALKRSTAIVDRGLVASLHPEGRRRVAGAGCPGAHASDALARTHAPWCRSAHHSHPTAHRRTASMGSRAK